jgi:hypothetical protein
VVAACLFCDDNASGRRFDATEAFCDVEEAMRGHDRVLVTTERLEPPAFRSWLPDFRREDLSIVADSMLESDIVSVESRKRKRRDEDSASTCDVRRQ